MQLDQAKKLIEALGSKPVYEKGSDWVRASCPMARWTHQNGKDSSPSFGIFVKEGEHSHFHCFSCHSGKLTELLQIMMMHLAKEPHLFKNYALQQAQQIIDDEEVEVLPLPEFSEFSPTAYVEFEEWPQYFIDSFTPWNLSYEATMYLKARGLTKELAFKHDLRYDPERQMIVHPYRNVYGKLAGARGRSINPDAKYRHHDYTFNKVNNAQLCWYNEEVLNDEKPVVVVEGQYDSYAVEKVYPWVIANMTAKPSQFKVRRLQQVPGAIFMLDNDATGDKAKEKYAAYCDLHSIPCAFIDLPKEYDDKGTLIKLDPDKMGPEWIKNQLSELGLL